MGDIIDQFLMQINLVGKEPRTAEMMSLVLFFRRKGRISSTGGQNERSGCFLPAFVAKIGAIGGKVGMQFFVSLAR